MKILCKTFILASFACLFTLQAFAQSAQKKKIPKDLVITYGVGFGDGSWSRSVIKADGRCYYESVSYMPENPKNYSKLLAKSNSSKLKDKLTKDELRLLISEFESIGEASFPNEILSRKEGCTNEYVTTHLRTTVISIHINGKTFSASFDTSCNPVADSIADKIENLAKQIEKMLENVKAIKASNSENKK